MPLTAALIQDHFGVSHATSYRWLRACTNGNCQKVCQDWLRMQFQMKRFLARERQLAKAEAFAQKRGGRR
jgi:hypothetical protein